jgi:hypothetical protein
MAKKKEEEFIFDDEPETKETKKSQEPELTDLDRILSKDPHEMIPWEEVKLPSRGIYYDSELMKEGVVKVRAMNFDVEKAMSNQRIARDGQSLDVMLEKCVQLPDPDFDHLDLLIGDRYYLMFYIRGISYGDDYTFQLKCPHCGHQDLYTFPMGELQQTLKIADPNLEYPFRVELPYMSKVMGTKIDVGIRLITGRDMEHIFKNRPDKNRIFSKKARVRKRLEPTRNGPVMHGKDEEDESVNITIKKSIIDVCGDTNPTKIEKFINMLHSQDLSIIGQTIDEVSPGIDTMIEIVCFGCETPIGPIGLPMTENFFRTTKSGGSRGAIS